MKLKQLLNQQEVLDIYDILVDDTIDPLSDYLTISVAHNANGTKISIETYEDQPCMNPTTIGISLAADLKSIFDSHLPDNLLNVHNISE